MRSRAESSLCTLPIFGLHNPATGFVVFSLLIAALTLNRACAADAVAGNATKIVRGRVVNEAGAPIGGARLWLRLQYRPSRVVPATSDDAGRFEMKFPADWVSARKSGASWTVWAFAPGYSIATESVYESLQGISDKEYTLALPPEGNVRFRILGPDGKPFAGARVQPGNYKTKSLFDKLPDEMLDSVAAVADADGIATLKALQPDPLFRVQIASQEFGQQTIRTDRDKTQPVRDIRLRGVGKIEGRLAAEKPEWVRGVRVVVGATNRDEWSSTEGNAEAVTGDDGRFEIPAFASGGPLNFFVDFDRSIPVRPLLSERHYVVEGETLKAEIPFVPAPIAQGKVLAKSTGKPIANAEISISYGTFRQSEQAVTNENGVYEARVLPGPVRSHIVVLPGDYAQLEETRSTPFQAPAGVQEFELPTIEVVSTQTLSGKLIGAEGLPLPTMRVSAGSANRRYGFGRTDAEGKFTMRVPEGMELDFSAHKEDEMGRGKTEVVQRDPLILRYVADNSEQQFAAERSVKADAAVVGRVLFDDKPLAGVSLALSRGIPVVSRIRRDEKAGAENMPATRMDKVGIFVTDAEGRYRLTGLKAGDTYQIIVTPPFPASDPQWRHQSPYWQKVPGNAQGDVTLPDMKLRKLTQSLAGIVVDPDGKPVAGARIIAVLRNGSVLQRTSTNGPPTWMETDKDGRFKLQQLPDEPLSLWASLPTKNGKRAPFPPRIDVEKNQQDIRIVLDPSLADEEE